MQGIKPGLLGWHTSTLITVLQEVSLSYFMDVNFLYQDQILGIHTEASPYCKFSSTATRIDMEGYNNLVT